MKKLILLLSVLALVFTSCSSDDDGGSQDPFIGTWKYIQYFEDDVEYPLEECENQDTLVISSNGTYNSTLYWDYGGGCEVDYQSSGTWENSSSGLYSTTDEDGDTYVQEVEFSGNTMYIVEVENGVTYKDVFMRQ